MLARLDLLLGGLFSLRLTSNRRVENRTVQEVNLRVVHDYIDECEGIRSILLVLRILESLLESGSNLTTLTLGLRSIPGELSRPLLTNRDTRLTTVNERGKQLGIQTLRATLGIHRTDLLCRHRHFDLPFSCI